jgi:hypothetical protein
MGETTILFFSVTFFIVRGENSLDMVKAVYDFKIKGKVNQ